MLRAIALALPVLLAAFVATDGASASPSRAHVYFFAGKLGIFFSSGLTAMADDLRKEGVDSTVYRYQEWEAAADAIAADYRNGRVRTIILGGYSAGAISVNGVVARLSRAGIPVRLAIGLDPLQVEAVSGSVGRYVNFYNRRAGAKAIAAGRGFRGAIQNVDISNVPDIDHTNVDDDRVIQTKILDTIRSAL